MLQSKENLLMKNIIPLIVAILISGCQKTEDTATREKTDIGNITALVNRAIDRDSSANNKLGNLLDYPLTSDDKYNSVRIDSITDNSIIYYSVLLENTNPLLNRFAVYDSVLTPLIVDKSLNGNIYFDKITLNGRKLIKTDEAYLSKDTLLLNRMSLYSPVSLVFRTHTKFVKPGSEYFQDIIEISDTLIKTKISGPKRFSLNNIKDTFRYNPSEMKYLSEDNLFDEFIKKEIEVFEYTPVKKQITK